MSDDTTRADRAGSVSSSSGETAIHDDNEKLARLDASEDGLGKDVEGADEREDAGLLPQVLSEKTEPPKATLRSSIIWMVVNTLATIGIVSDGQFAPCPSVRAELTAVSNPGLHQQGHL